MIDLNNESGVEVDEQRLVQLARFAMDQLRIHPQAELSILLVDEATMADYHQRFMNLPGPTDVLSFPMDELRPPADDEEPPEGLLGDIVLCPRVTAAQAAENGRTPEGEADYLLVHGILHLLGYDHVTPEQERQMFGLQRQLLLTFFALRHDANVQATLPAGTPDALALYDAAHGAGRDLDSK